MSHIASPTQPLSKGGELKRLSHKTYKTYKPHRS